MKRAPYPISPDTSGKQYWRSLGELEKTPEFAESQPREFPEDATEPKGVDRRGFLGIMGASLALTGLAACRRPEELIVPYTRAPEEFIPGRPVFYATALPFMGTAVGLVVESHEGRPTKIEGNPRHPESQGGTHKFLQSAVLDLYDPDRSQTPAERGEARNWDQATAFLRTLGDDAKRRNGKGLAIIVEDHRSPAMAAQLDTIVRLMPDTRIVRYEAFGDDNAAEGARAAFGRALVPVYDLDNADVVVSLDSDFLVNEGAPVRNARGYGARRDPERKDKKLNRFYAIESAHTVTGSNADHRLRLQSRLVPAFTYALARELADAQKVALPAEIAGAAGAAQLDPKAARYVKAIAADLARANGAVAIIPGRKQPAAVHALVHAMNAALGAVGKAVKLVRPFDELKSGPAELVAVAKAIGTDIDTVLILGSNPAFNAPADAAFGEALKKAKTVVHVGTHVDETGKLAHWHLNRAHPLEAWGDVRSEDGTGSIVQPLIAPMYGGKTDAEILELFLGGTRRGYDLVRASWHDAGTQNAEFDRAFRRALHDGVWDKSAWAVENADPRGAEIAAAIKAQQAAAPKGEYEVVFEPDPHTYDGRYANNGWLQEMPDTMHKLTWSNVAALAPSTARKLGIVDGDLVTVSVGGASVTLPALLAPGQADGTIVVTVGQGRTAAGRVGNGIGFATTPLRTSAAFHIADATLSKAGGSVKLPRTQEHFMTEGRPLVEEATAEEYAKGGRVTEEPKRYLSLFPSREYKDTAWGMTVDLSTCIACNACTVACQAENNISLVGAEGVLLSREMHWLRIDRYFEGPNPDEAKAVAQPMLCQHCENAPCEEVCPVAATSHSPEGLNEMTYNRCVGTKYCANNCPFKVRRFNYFDYTKDTIEQRKMQFNPDVTVRSRGVMEKCTFCVQRINGAKIAAKVENRPIKDGEIVTACQGACPTRAITFGDLNDKASLVAKKADGPRGYRLLEELNVRPRLVYLAKIRNPNPELEGV